MAYSFDANANIQQIIDNDTPVRSFTAGEAIKGIVVGMSKKQILVDIDGQVTGVISGRELNDVMGIAKDLELGQEVLAIVLEEEDDEGLLKLSLRKAGQIRAWDYYLAAYESQKTVEIQAHAANKGGLLVDVAGIKAFLPVSQLSPENYPRVDDASSTKILEKLNSLVGRKLPVRVIGIDKEEGKLIFSERQAAAEKRVEAMRSVKAGDVVKGRITGVVKFGVFVSFNDLEGLVHISEIAWGHVKNPSHYAKVGDEVDVKVIGVEGEKISLSIKQLQEDPWAAAAEKYKVGETVKGIINKVSDFGAFVTLSEDVNGLIHLSEIDHDLVTNPNDYFKEGAEVEAKVIDVDLKEHRIALSTKALKPAPEKTKEEKAEKKPAKKEEAKPAKKEKEEKKEEAAE